MHEERAQGVPPPFSGIVPALADVLVKLAQPLLSPRSRPRAPRSSGAVPLELCRQVLRDRRQATIALALVQNELLGNVAQLELTLEWGAEEEGVRPSSWLKRWNARARERRCDWLPGREQRRAHADSRLAAGNCDPDSSRTTAPPSSCTPTSRTTPASVTSSTSTGHSSRRRRCRRPTSRRTAPGDTGVSNRGG